MPKVSAGPGAYNGVPVGTIIQIKLHHYATTNGGSIQHQHDGLMILPHPDDIKPGTSGAAANDAVYVQEVWRQNLSYDNMNFTSISHSKFQRSGQYISLELLRESNVLGPDKTTNVDAFVWLIKGIYNT